MSSHDQREPEAEPGLLDATIVEMGAMIGAGIFVLTGLAAEISGAAALLAFLLSGVVAAFTGLSYAELASTIPKSGGGYAFVREIFNDFGTPFAAVLLSAVVMLGFVFLHTQSAGNTSSLFFLLSFMIVNIAVIRLRQEWPSMNCPYKIPYYPIPPILAIVLNGVLAVVADSTVPQPVIERQGEYIRLSVRNERSDQTGRNRVTNRRVMKPT